MRHLALAIFLIGGAAQADGIAQVPYDDLRGQTTALIDFESAPKIVSPGTRLDPVQRYDGASFAERFVGQTLDTRSGFDVLTGRPAPPLRLRPGSEGQNLAVAFFFYLSNQLIGHAPPGYPAIEAEGEGAISVLFDRDQEALGFRVAAELAGDSPGWITVAFFTRAGTQIDSLIIPLAPGRKGYGFARSGGQSDIAGISITNRDPAGIAIDDVIFDKSAVLGMLR